MSKSCGELEEMLELYALGVLEAADREEIDEHLKSGCTTCQENLRGSLAMNAILLGSCADAAPSRHLKRRILASIGVRHPGWGWLGAVAAACLLVLTLWLANEERARSQELVQARQNILQMASERDRLAQALSILDQPETVQVTFGKGKPQPPRGNVFLHSKLGVMLIASNLPKLGPGRIYEMWLIPKGGTPKPAGLFLSNNQLSAMHFLAGPVDTADLSAVAVTVEPEAGSPSPTSQPLIVAGV